MRHAQQPPARSTPTPTIDQVLRFKRGEEHEVPDLVTIESHAKVGQAIELMQRYSISQLPVVRDGDTESLADVVGSLQERGVLDRVFKNPDALNDDVAVAMQPPLATVDAAASVDEVFAELTGSGGAVVVGRAGKPVAIITRGPTRGDGEATHQLDAPLGPTLTALVDRLAA